MIQSGGLFLIDVMLDLPDDYARAEKKILGKCSSHGSASEMETSPQKKMLPICSPQNLCGPAQEVRGESQQQHGNNMPRRSPRQKKTSVCRTLQFSATNPSVQQRHKSAFDGECGKYMSDYKGNIYIIIIIIIH